MAGTPPQRPGRRGPRLFYGWFVVLGGVGIQAVQGALLNSSYGAYVVLLQRDFGWSKTTFSFAYSLQQIEQGLIGPLQGWMIDRFGARSVMRIGIVTFGLGFMLLSRFHSVAMFFTAMVVIAFGVSMGGFLPIAATIVNWFVRRRSTAMGLMSTGMGIGGFLAPAVAWSLTAYGWRATAFASGVIAIVVGLPLTQLMRHSPEPHGYLPDGDPPAHDTSRHGVTDHHLRPLYDTSNDFTVAQAMRTSAFWLIAFGHSSALLVVSAVNVHLVSHLEEQLSYSVTTGAAMVTLVTTMSMVGQISGGFVGDRFSKRLLAMGCMFMHGAGLLLLAYATTLWMVIVFAVLHGLAWGIRGPQMQSIRADYFGRSSFGKIYGVSAPIIMLGTTGGPMVAGAMADAFGNYQAGFTILSIGSAMGSLFWLLLRKPSSPAQRRPNVSHRDIAPSPAPIAADADRARMGSEHR
jgi:sugar phosphate permease